MESLGESSLSTAHASSPSDHEHSDFRSDSAVNATLTAVDEATVIGSGERDHDPASHSGSELDGHPGPESDDELCSHRSPRQGCHAPSMATSRSSRRPPVQSGVHDVQRRVTASRQVRWFTCLLALLGLIISCDGINLTRHSPLHKGLPVILNYGDGFPCVFGRSLTNVLSCSVNGFWACRGMCGGTLWCMPVVMLRNEFHEAGAVLWTPQ